MRASAVLSGVAGGGAANGGGSMTPGGKLGAGAAAAGGRSGGRRRRRRAAARQHRQRDDQRQRRGQRASDLRAVARGRLGTGIAGDIAAGEDVRNRRGALRVDDGGESAAGRVEDHGGAMLPRQLRSGRGERGHRHQRALELPGGPVRRPELEPAHLLRSPRADDRLAREIDARRADPGPVQRALEGRRGRRTVEDDHRALGRHRSDAPVERQPPAGACGDHPWSIVVGERVVLIIAARRVERAPRPHAQQPIAGHDRQEPTPAIRGLVLRVVADGRRARDEHGAGAAGRLGHRCRPGRAAGLGEQRAAGSRLLVIERDARAGRRLGDRARRRQPRRSAADHADVERLVARREAGGRGRVGHGPRAAHLAHQLQEQGVAGVAAGHHRMVVHPLGEQPVGGGQQVDVGAGEGVLACAGEIGARRRQAGALVGAAVDSQQTGGAVSVEAEEPARTVILGRSRQRLDPGGVQRHGDRLAREGGNGRPFEVDGDGEAAGGARRKVSQVGGHVLNLPARHV